MVMVLFYYQGSLLNNVTPLTMWADWNLLILAKGVTSNLLDIQFE